MNEDGKGFTVTVTMRSSTLSSLIDGAYIVGALIAERLAPGPAALPLAIAVIAVYLAWSLGPQAILCYRRKRSRPGNPGEPRS
jgi:hypothetical protein